MRKFLYIISAIIILAMICGSVLFLALVKHIPRLPDDLGLLASSPATEVYDRNGNLLSTSGGREYVSLDRISLNFRQAVIAAEDKRFWEHRGVDHISIFRAVVLNIIRLGGAPGGSTITQQLTKNLFFTLDRSWKRKLLEAMAAMAIEDRFSKEDILEAYCNLVPFGQYSYGIERASKTYFGKHASELSTQEAALLAGLPNAPSRLNPFNHFERAKMRQIIILKRMAKLKFIPPQALDSLSAAPVKLIDKRLQIGRGSFAVDHALDLARRKVGEDPVNYGGVRIYTSIDKSLQSTAESILSRGIDALEERLQPQKPGNQSSLEGSLVAIDVGTGQIVALVGGRDYGSSSYNRAVRSLRPPGSSFKPVIYLTALAEQGFTPVTIVNDTLVEFQIDKKRTWKPQNFDHKQLGRMTLKLALMKSRNCVAAQLIDRVTPARAIKTARALGIKSKLEPHLAISLGAQGVTPVDMATAYATLARGGIALEPHLVSRIVGGGETLFEYMTAGESRFAPEIVYQLLDMMEGVIDGGTGSVIRRRGFKGVAAGKTGTSSDFRDSWFVGSTPDLAVAIWVGYDDNREMRLKNRAGVTGASGAAPIWADFMIQATAHAPLREFPRPQDIGQYYVEPVSGRLSAEPIEGYISAALKIEYAEELLRKIAEEDSLQSGKTQPDSTK